MRDISLSAYKDTCQVISKSPQHACQSYWPDSNNRHGLELVIPSHVPDTSSPPCEHICKLFCFKNNFSPCHCYLADTKNDGRTNRHWEYSMPIPRGHKNVMCCLFVVISMYTSLLGISHSTAGKSEPNLKLKTNTSPCLFFLSRPLF